MTLDSESGPSGSPWGPLGALLFILIFLGISVDVFHQNPDAMTAMCFGLAAVFGGWGGWGHRD